MSHAYDILKDPEKRAAYDRYGAAAFEGGAGPGGPFQGGQGFDFGSVFGDIFEEMFGANGARGRGRADMRGQDLRFNLEITLEQAYSGTEATVRVPSSITCEVCHGSGAEAGSKPQQCPTCQGRGRIRAQQGFFTVERACHTCHGAGQVIDKPCKNCGGQGRVRREKTLKVNIPSGVEDGTRIRLSGEGEAGARGGPAGDLYVFLSVRRHQLFEREGPDVHCRVPISMVQATLGGNIEVPTLDGKMARINIPAGAQGGHQFRMRGKGMPIMRSSQHGDMYIEINVETPTNLTAKQKELLKEFEKAGKTSPESEGFFSKVKEMFGG
ncbi:MAG: molecular chaperone DnaJ [Brevundimonas diminuta]|nr:MAG: molecular chaperone DnaJ [Brevundimonas diminuta]